jgi:succinate dehydrogenase assembly factor 2
MFQNGIATCLPRRFQGIVNSFKCFTDVILGHRYKRLYDGYPSIRCRPSSSFYFSTDCTFEIESVESKRSRLLYQSRKRGILENDLLFAAFAAHSLPTMSENELAEYDVLLHQENEWEIFGWVTGARSPPEYIASSVVFKNMQQFVHDHQRKKNTVDIFHIFSRQPDLNSIA